MTDDRDTLITIAVSDKPHYITKIAILDRPFNLKCGYNTRNKLRWITITDQNDRPLLTQTFLKAGKLCQLNFLSNRYDLSFSVTLKPKDALKEIPEDYDYLNWSKDFDLYILGRSQSMEDKYKANWREVYVGS